MYLYLYLFPLRQPFSASSQTPIPPLSAIVSISSTSPTYVFSPVSICLTPLLLNRHFCQYIQGLCLHEYLNLVIRKTNIQLKLSKYREELKKKPICMVFLIILSVMSLVVRTPAPLCQPMSAFALPPLPFLSAIVSILLT